MGDLTLKLGDFAIVSLDRENPMYPESQVHYAFVRYNGMMPSGNGSVLAFEIGRYFKDKEVQEGHSHFIPADETNVNCRVDTYGRTVKFEILELSPLEITAKDLIERQSAVRD